MQNNAVAGRQISRACTLVCVHARMCLFAIVNPEKLPYCNLTALFIGLSLLGLARVCAGAVWPTRIYKSHLLLSAFFFISLLAIPLSSQLFPKAGSALINLPGLVCHAVKFAVFSTSCGHRATYLYIIQTREFILNGIHESIQQLLKDCNVSLKKKIKC